MSFPNDIVPLSSFNIICRTCMLVKENCSIFEVNCGNISICKILEQYSNIKIAAGDRMPTNICQDCIELLSISYNFLEMCKQSDRTLKKSLDTLVLEKLKVTEKIIVKIEADGNDSKIKCEHCNLMHSKDAYAMHTKPTKSKCKVCQVQFPCDEVLKQHNESNVHKELTLNENYHQFCIPCDLVFNSYEEFTQHYLVEHSSDIKCIQCLEEFSNMVGHLPKHEIEGRSNPKECQICGKKFKSRWRRDLHWNVHTQECQYKCVLCGSQFKYSNSLKRHMNIHNGLLHLCSECGRSFTTAYNLRLHINKDHVNGNMEKIKKKTYMCEVCGCLCQNVTIYNNHVSKKHSQNKITISCSICKLTFEDNYELKRHMDDSHKKYECHICGKKLLYHAGYKTHLERHKDDDTTGTNKSNLSCPDCGKLFRFKTTLTYHMHVHTGLKPYQCRVCTKSFRQPAHLRTHMYQHTGERKYKCQYCPKAFILPSLLNIHVRVHTGEKPYACPVCHKAFHDVNVMKKHRRRHMHHNQDAFLIEDIKIENEGLSLDDDFNEIMVADDRTIVHC